VKLEVSSFDELGEASGEATKLSQSRAGSHFQQVGEKASSEAKVSLQQG